MNGTQNNGINPPLDNVTDQFVQKLMDLSSTYGIRILGAVAIIVVGYIVARILSKKVEKLMLKMKNVDLSIASIVRKMSFVGLMILVFMAVLERFGVETTSFIALLGAAGLAIGLALQGTLSNIAAGVVLLVLRPFRAGDVIQIGGGEIYIVDEIALFVTRAHKPDCPRVVIPNAKIWGDTIINYTDTVDQNRRFDIVFSVSYSDHLGESIEVLKKLIDEDDRVLSEPQPLVKVESLGDSAVNILFRVYTKSDVWWDAKLDLTKQGKEALESAGKSIPFPQHDVHMISS